MPSHQIKNVVKYGVYNREGYELALLTCQLNHRFPTDEICKNDQKKINQILNALRMITLQ